MRNVSLSNDAIDIFPVGTYRITGTGQNNEDPKICVASAILIIS